MKILVVYQHYYPEPFRITDICESLVKDGHEVTVLTGLPNYPEGYVLADYKHGKNRRENINGVNVLRCYTIGRRHNILFRFLNYYSYSISSCIAAKKLPGDFDVVLAYQTSPVMMSRAALSYKKKYGKKVFLYCLDLWPASLAAGGIKKDSFIYKIYKKVSRSIYSKADILGAGYMSFLDYFKDELSITDSKMCYIPQYAEDLFSDIAQNEAPEKKDRLDLVFAGNIGKAQSVETIIRAAGELKDRTDIFWHIVGDGTSCEACKKLSNELGLKNVIFYGRKPLTEMGKYYSMADAMLLTLFKDEVISYTLPGKTQTYMASAKPILAAANGETKRVIVQSGCGLCAEAEDYAALAENVRTFASMLNREDMGKAARRYYDENFSKDIVLYKLIDVLTELSR